MPFKKLIVENFECHKYKKINLKDRNIIIGNNDAGKSAIIRALHWVCFNTRNFSFKNDVRHGAEFCRVTLFVDSHKIERYRSKSKNYYKLDGKKYKAIGHKVPSVIAQILNLGDYNFQMQLDLPFWVSETPGKVSKKLNEVVDLAIMDRAIKEVSNMSKKAKYEIQAIEELRDLYKEKDFEGLDELKSSLDAYRKVKDTAKNLNDMIVVLDKKGSQIAAESKKQLNLFSLILRLKTCLKSAKMERLYTEQIDKLNECSAKHANASRIVLFASKHIKRVISALKDWNASKAILERFRNIVNPLSLEQETQKEKLTEIERCRKFLKGRKCPVCQKTIT